MPANQTKLPTFRELAQTRIEDAGPRDHVINIKATVNTARMMIEQEQAELSAARADADRLAAALEEAFPLLDQHGAREYRQAVASARAALAQHKEQK